MLGYLCDVMSFSVCIFFNISTSTYTRVHTNLLHVVLSENSSVVFVDVFLLPVLQGEKISD